MDDVAQVDVLDRLVTAHFFIFLGGHLCIQVKMSVKVDVRRTLRAWLNLKWGAVTMIKDDLWDIELRDHLIMIDCASKIRVGNLFETVQEMFRV